MVKHMFEWRRPVIALNKYYHAKEEEQCMNETKYWVEEVKYWKNLARYFYLINLIHCDIEVKEEEFTDEILEAYTEWCRRDDLFNMPLFKPI